MPRTSPIQILLIVILSLVIFQGLAIAITPIVPQAAVIKLGPLFMLLLLGVAMGIAVLLLLKGFDLDKRSVFFLLVALAIIIILMLKLKQFVPQIFSVLVR